MKLIVESKLAPEDVANLMSKAKKCYGSRYYLTFLTQFWQALSEVSMTQKNGASWLMSEKISLLCPQITHITGIALYFISEKETSKKKYVVELALKILDGAKEIARVELTLLSEVTWHE